MAWTNNVFGRKLCALAGLAAGVGLVTNALAQTPAALPDLFQWSNWQPRPDGNGNAYFPPNVSLEQTNGLTLMVRVETIDFSTNPPSARAAIDCARATAADIFHRTASGRDLDPQAGRELCLSFSMFGRDGPDCDLGGSFYATPLRFYTETDRLPRRLGSAPNYTYTTTDLGWQFPVTAEQYVAHTDRCYRHPFLQNADPSNLGAPLRVWMEDFLREFMAERSRLGQARVPIPSRVYFDAEPGMTWAGSLTEVYSDEPLSRASANFVHILKEIYQTRETTDPVAYPNLWNDPSRRIPWDRQAPKRTLEQRYLDDAAKFGLPLKSNGAPDLGGLTAFTGTMPNHTPVSAAESVNRNIMAWWAEVCQEAIEAAMEHCAYTPIKQVFGSSVLVGNYDTSTNGGELGRGGLYYDSTCNPPPGQGPLCDTLDNYLAAVNGDPLPEVHAFKDMLPRLHPGRGLDMGLFWRLTPDTSATQRRRWGAIKQTARGDVDSPTLYPIASAAYQYTYLRHPNPFRPLGPGGTLMRETVEETALRVNRMAAEATARGHDAGSERRLVPWITAAGQQLRDPTRDLGPVFDHTILELSRLLAMLRGKAIQEAIVFNSTLPTAENAAPTWNLTRDALRNVYKAYITGYTPSDGVSTGDIAALETTLLWQGARKTVDVSSSQVGSEAHESWLEVDLAGIVYNDPMHPDYYSGELYHFLVLVEAQTAVASSPGEVPPVHYVETRMVAESDNVPGNFIPLRTEFGTFVAQSGNHNLGHIRAGWVAGVSTVGVSGAKKVRIHSKAAHPFTIKFDLLQVVPIPMRQLKINYSWYPNSNTPNSRENPIVARADEFGAGLPTSLDSGFEIRWTGHIGRDDYFADQVPGQTERFPVRVYRHIGTATQPLEDITCSTVQTLLPDTQDPTRNLGVSIKYAPLVNGVRVEKQLLPGLYQFTTRNQDATTGGVRCASYVYSDLRTFELSEFYGQPQVADELMWVAVVSENAPPMTCVRGSCPADVDNGDGDGVPDGAVGIEDLLYFLVAFDTGSLCADVDDGSATGTLDNGVGIEDLLYYLIRYETGC